MKKLIIVLLMLITGVGTNYFLNDFDVKDAKNALSFAENEVESIDEKEDIAQVENAIEDIESKVEEKVSDVKISNVVEQKESKNKSQEKSASTNEKTTTIKQNNVQESNTKTETVKPAKKQEKNNKNTDTTVKATPKVEEKNNSENTKPKEEQPKPIAKEENKETSSKSIYDYAFDIDAIKKELIKIGENMGLKHKTTDGGKQRTPSNSSWSIPVTANEKLQGKKLERALKDYVSSMPQIIESYGGNKIEDFTIYVENNGNGSYTFYFLY